MTSEPESILVGLVGQRCWRARRGHGTFLTFEFGEELADGHGEWHLWVYSGDWTIRHHDSQVLWDTASDEEIDHAVEWIQGRVLVAATVNSITGATTFTFDGEHLLAIDPCSSDDDPESEWWMLFTPGEKVLAALPGPTWTDSSAHDS